MYFDEQEKFKNAKLNPHLLWEYEVSDNFDYDKMKNIVVQRVIQLGKKEDFYAIFNLYGGIDKVVEIIKNINFLSKKDMNFVSVIFNIKLEDLKCYTKMLSMKKPMLY